jgi:hypothetical protein
MAWWPSPAAEAARVLTPLRARQARLRVVTEGPVVDHTRAARWGWRLGAVATSATPGVVGVDERGEGGPK